ncbi:hypothetical protein [Streptomyces sp. NPDC002785]|uniref:hypothetical protein n=1 Tax=Streptomyces sp. NPDC002785 TaxID=3154543 RepID=UPI0033347048
MKAADPYLASAVMRRLHLWEQLTDDSTVTITSQPDSEGSRLAWTVERALPPSVPLHDDALAVVLADTVAGPGLTADADTHRCDQKECVQTFASGGLAVRTVRREGARSTRQRTLARGTSAILHERQVIGRPVGEGPGGHVLQLIDDMRDERRLTHAAEQLAAAWAQQGLCTLVLRLEGRDSLNDEQPWQRSRLTGGPGAMFKSTVNYLNDNHKAVITKARAHFDHVIMVKHQSVDFPWAGISPLADDHLVVAFGGFPKVTRSTTVHAGKLQRDTIELTPAESAVAWLHGRLARIPFADVPITGLLLQCAPDEHGPNSFDGLVDTELARHGMPVLGRLPQPKLFTPCRTVLDDLPDEQRAFVLRQSAEIRTSLGPARADGSALVVALRELSGL